MSGWSSIVLKAVDAAADAVGSIPVNGAGTAAEQIKLYGFSAEIMGAEADAVVHEVPVGVAITAVLIGVGAVATLSAVEIPLLGGAAIPVLASYFADLTLPIIGGVIARSSLIQVISGVLEVGAAGIAESIVDAPLNNFTILCEKILISLKIICH